MSHSILYTFHVVVFFCSFVCVCGGGGLEPGHFFRKVLRVSVLCNLFLQQLSFLHIQTLHNDCLYIEDVHLLVCVHLINIFVFWWTDILSIQNT